MDQVCLERGRQKWSSDMPSLQEVKGHRTDPRLSYKEDRAPPWAEKVMNSLCCM